MIFVGIMKNMIFISSEAVYLVAIALGIAALSVMYLYKSTTSEKRSRQYPLPPGPACYPIVGCLPQMLRNKPTFRWIQKYMHTLNTDIACFRFGRVHVIAISSPELAGEFFKEQDAIFATRPESMSGRVTSSGFLSTVLAPAGNQWKKMRKVMASEVLTAGMHAWLHEKRCEEADYLVRYVYNKSKNGGAVNVREAARLYCGCVIRRVVFGKRFFGPGSEDGGPGVEEREHMDAVWIILSYTYGFAIADYVPLLEIFDFDGHKKILTDAYKSLRAYQDREIDNRVDMWRNGVRNANEDIVDVMINLKDSNNHPLLSLEEIKAQVVDIFVGGIDNPSNVVEWAIAEMMKEPHTLVLAAKELDQVVGKKRLVQESDLYRLNYIKACAKEALRLHPVAPFNLPHMATADIVVGGYFIPKGSHVLLSRLGLGRNPRVWEDPLKFKPERHLYSQVVVLNDPELKMWTFGAGRRGCPALTFGSTIMTMLLARLLHAFHWAPPSHEPDYDFTESPGHLFFAKPLIARAIPRLDPNLYQQIIM